MFHFPEFPPHTLYIQVQVTRHDSCQVSPFGHPRITARLPTPQGLSQAPTSFIGSRCQGIHHAPFIACLTNQQNNHYKVLASTIQISNNNPTPPTTPHHRGATSSQEPKPPHPPPTPTRGAETAGLRSQNPNSAPTPHHPHTGDSTGVDGSTSEPPPTTTRHSLAARGVCSLERR